MDSALGRSRKAALTLQFPQAHPLVAFGASHLDLLDRADVDATIASWLGAPS